ncbi:MAG: hypothetical protein IPI73_10215 [Betaproteobacteria bacterium]|nr:hypothetical protein [Betaproteobacteria bacterium]
MHDAPQDRCENCRIDGQNSRKDMGKQDWRLLPAFICARGTPAVPA